MIKKIIILAAVAIALCACKDTTVRMKAKSLDDAISEYNVGLRWGMMDVLESYHVGTDGQRISIDRDAFERVRITDYSVVEQEVNPEVTEANVQAEIDYYTTDSGRLKKVTISHHWWYDEESNRWFNDGGLPEFN